MPLKDVELRALKPRDRVYKRADERGLYIEVHPSGSKLWRLRYRYLGKDKRIALGAYPEVGLAEARRKRDEVRQKLRGGRGSAGRAPAGEAGCSIQCGEHLWRGRQRVHRQDGG